MPLTVSCPHPECRQPISLTPEQVQPVLRCPHCHREFALSEAVRQAGPASEASSRSETLPPPKGADKAGPVGADDPTATAFFSPSVADPSPVSVPGYEILGELGRGNMGVVYRARQLTPNRVVALKMILSGEHAGSDERRRFLAEAEAVARLEHPNIVPLYEVGEHEGRSFFSMQYAEGGTLANQLEGGPLAPGEAARVVEEVARGVHAAHQRGIIHRDLKPANVLMGEADIPKVTDFGLAKHLDAQAVHTQSGAVVGTPAYMAPEQASGQAHAIGPPTDVYALGVILYECLTGRPPFEGPTHLVLYQVRDLDPVPPRRRNQQVPRDLETVCLKCLEKKGPRRYPSAHDLAEDLARFRRHEPIMARRATGLERLVLWGRRRPALATIALLALSVLGLSVVAGGMAWLWLEAERARRLADGQRRVADQERRNAQALAEAREEERQQAVAARAAEVQARREVEGLKERIDQLLYANRIALAHREWEVGNPVRARALLDSCRWDLRDWEHAHLNTHFAHNGQRALRGHTGWVSSVAFSPDGTRIVSGGEDRTVRVWDAQKGTARFSLEGRTGKVYAVAYSPDGERFATGGEDQSVRVWNGQNGKELLALTDHSGGVYGIAYSPDGTRLASVSGEWAVKVWDAEKGAELLTLLGHTSFVYSVAFSPDSTRIVSGGEDRTVRVWDAHRGTLLLSLVGHGDVVRAVAFSPDGSRLASASWDRTVRVWDANEGTQLFSLQGHTGKVYGVAFSPDGSRLASASEDGTVKIWDTHQGTELLSLGGHGDIVRAVAFSPDGSRLASASWDQTVRVWDAHQGAAVLSLKEHTGPVQSVGLSRDGLHIVSRAKPTRVGERGKVLVWDVRTGEFLSLGTGPSPPRVVLQEGGLGEGLCARIEGSTIHLRLCGPPDATLWMVPAADQGTVQRHLMQARNADYDQDWFAAVYHLTQLLRYAPHSEVLRQQRAQAVALYLQGHPDDTEALLAQARLRLDVGDHTGYRKACSRLGKLLGNRRGRPLARRLAWVCCLAPDALDDLDPYLQSSRDEEAKPATADTARILGGLLLRAGKPRQALDFLHQAEKEAGGPEMPVEELLLALTYHRLGEYDEARRWFDRADAWLRKPLGGRPLPIVSLLGLAGHTPLTSVCGFSSLSFGPLTEPLLLGWERWLECEILYREARQALGEKR